MSVNQSAGTSIQNDVVSFDSRGRLSLCAIVGVVCVKQYMKYGSPLSVR